MRPANDRIDFLDTYRGAAVLAVFCYHCLEPGFSVSAPTWNGNLRVMEPNTGCLLFSIASFGVYGVAIFFAISGFCIQLSVAQNESVNWSNFFLRRTFRILPTYWFWLAIFALFSVITALQADQPAIGPKNFLAHAMLAQNLRESIAYSINPSFWSLAIEGQLYALFPLVLVAARRIGWRTVLGITGIVEVLFRIWAATPECPIRPSIFTPLNYWWSWTIGAYVADQFSRHSALPLSRIPVSLCFFIIVIAWSWKPASVLVFPLVSLGTAVMLSQQLASRLRSLSTEVELLSKRPGLLASVGICSYSFYLIHQPVLMATGRLLNQNGAFGDMAKLACLLLLAVPIYWVSLASYRWLEIPSHRFGKALAQRGTSPTL